MNKVFEIQSIYFKSSSGATTRPCGKLWLVEGSPHMDPLSPLCQPQLATWTSCATSSSTRLFLTLMFGLLLSTKVTFMCFFFILLLLIEGLFDNVVLVTLFKYCRNTYE